MSTVWRVSYPVEGKLLVLGPSPDYSSFGLSLQLDDLRLTGITDEFEVTGPISSERALSIFRERIAPFLDILAFRQGLPVRLGGPCVSMRETETDSFKKVLTFVTAPASVLLSQRVALPSPQGMATLSAELRHWIYIANRARAGESDVNALRDYYIVSESWGGKPRAISDDLQNLKWARDFVSHAKLDSKSLLSWLAIELGEGTDRFDSTNPTHVRFVRLARVKARTLIEKELETRLREVSSDSSEGPGGHRS